MSAPVQVSLDAEYVMPSEKWRGIVREVADQFGVTVGCICGQSREIGVLKARYEAIYRIRKELGYSTVKIGMIIGRDHSSIVNALKKHDRIKEIDSMYYRPGAIQSAYWTPNEDAVLREAFASGWSDATTRIALAQIGSNRTQGGIEKRRRKLNLIHFHCPEKRKPKPVKKRSLPPAPRKPHPHEPYVRFAIALMREAGAETVGDLKAYVRRQELDLPPEKPFVWHAPMDDRSYVGSHFGDLPRGMP